MARLYNGFNALALGQAINNTNNDIHNRRMTGLQMLGEGVKDYLKEREEEQRKQSAIDFLVGNGMTQENASSLANSGIEPGQLALYMQGRLDKTADTTDERKYAEDVRKEGYNRADFEYNRNLSDTRADKEKQLAYDEAQDEKKFNRSRAASIEDKEFEAINGEIFTLEAKANSGTLMSQQDWDNLANAKRRRAEWLKAHPHYTQIDDSLGSNVGTERKPWTTETATASLRALIGDDGRVDPKSLKDLNETFLYDTGMNMYDVPELKALYKNVEQKQKGKKTVRNTQNPGSGNITTAEDYENILKDEKENQRLNGLLASVKTALVNGGGYPELSERDIALLTKKDKATMGLYNRIMSRNKGR